MSIAGEMGAARLNRRPGPASRVRMMDSLAQSRAQVRAGIVRWLKCVRISAADREAAEAQLALVQQPSLQLHTQPTRSVQHVSAEEMFLKQELMDAEPATEFALPDEVSGSFDGNPMGIGGTDQCETRELVPVVRDKHSSHSQIDRRTSEGPVQHTATQTDSPSCCAAVLSQLQTVQQQLAVSQRQLQDVLGSRPQLKTAATQTSDIASKAAPPSLGASASSSPERSPARLRPPPSPDHSPPTPIPSDFMSCTLDVYDGEISVSNAQHSAFLPAADLPDDSPCEKSVQDRGEDLPFEFVTCGSEVYGYESEDSTDSFVEPGVCESSQVQAAAGGASMQGMSTTAVSQQHDPELQDAAHLRTSGGGAQQESMQLQYIAGLNVTNAHVLPMAPARSTTFNSGRITTLYSPASFVLPGGTGAGQRMLLPQPTQQPPQVPSSTHCGQTPRPLDTTVSAHQCDVCYRKFPQLRGLNVHKSKVHPVVSQRVGVPLPSLLLPVPQPQPQPQSPQQSEQRRSEGPQTEASLVPGHALTNAPITGSSGSQVRPWGCNQCGRMFTLAWHLRRHMLIHTGEKQYHCSSCPMAFARADHYQKHLTAHSLPTNRQLICPLCGECFSQPVDLRTHKRTVHPSALFCPFCPTTHKHHTDLRMHIARHRILGEIPTKPTEQCRPKPSSQLDPMLVTAQVPSPASPGEALQVAMQAYQCDDCGRSFPQLRGLNVHKKKMHPAVSQLTCTHCQGSFCNHAAYQFHLQSSIGCTAGSAVGKVSGEVSTQHGSSAPATAAIGTSSSGVTE